MSVVSTAAAAHRRPASDRSAARALPVWWPLAALTLLAAVLRLSTLDLQSFWYDEAFTPVHVLHPSLSATLTAMVHSENTPPLWYVLVWADSRILGTGEVALRLPSALAGIATVPVAWGIGRELSGRGAAIACAALVAVNPLFVWYSQEARAYGLFVLCAALAMLCFLRAEHEPTRGRMALFALTGALALLSHYFAVFLLIPMVLWLLFGPGERRPQTRRAALGAVGVLVLVGLALLPLISAQGGHGTQWIGRWPLSERLQAIPQYYLTGYSGAPLGHGVELLVALVILAALAVGLRAMLATPRPAARPGTRAPAPPSHGQGEQRGEERGEERGEADRARARRGALIALSITAAGVLLPIVLVAFGADYLAPRNLVGAMIPLSALIAVVATAPGSGRAGAALVASTALLFLLITIDVDLSPRLQRGNWRGVAHALRGGAAARAITTVELGSAPLEYYIPGLHGLEPGGRVTVSEIDETGYAPLIATAGSSPAPGFHLLARLDIDGLIVYRFVSPVPRAVGEAALRGHVITAAQPSVLIAPGARVSATGVATGSSLARLPSERKKI